MSKIIIQKSFVILDKQKMKFSGLLAVFTASVISQAQAGDAYKKIEQICQENGFALESYTLVTPDDYVLSLYRIPGTFSDLKNKT